MAKEKRKRADAPADDEGSVDEESHASEMVEVNEAEQTFQVEVLKGNTKPKTNKRRKMGDWTDVMTETDFPGAPVRYVVSPGREWHNMKKYKNFVVQDKNFGTGDYIFVKPTVDIQGVDDLGWVGKVLEIRARDATAVFVRIFWLYWQSELPMGSQPYHAEQELIMSNFMQIIDAQTVDGMVPMTHMIEDRRDDPAAEGYFWRQTLDVLTGKLSNLKKDCICGKPHNPDTLLLQCSSCAKWQHELCVVDEVLRQQWRQLSNGVNGTNGTTDDANNPLPTPASVQDTIALSPQKTPKKGKGGRKPGKLTPAKKKAATSEAATTGPAPDDRASEPWFGVLEGMLQRDEKTMTGSGEDSDEITGKVVVTDSRDPKGNRELVDAKCLFCQQLLKGSSIERQVDGEEEEEEKKSEEVLKNGDKNDAVMTKLLDVAGAYLPIGGGGGDSSPMKSDT